MINREYYLNQIISKMRDGNIKVITGIRRCGKSTLLFELFHDYLINSGVEENSISKRKQMIGEMESIVFQKFYSGFAHSYVYVPQSL